MDKIFIDHRKVRWKVLKVFTMFLDFMRPRR